MILNLIQLVTTRRKRHQHFPQEGERKIVNLLPRVHIVLAVLPVVVLGLVAGGLVPGQLPGEHGHQHHAAAPDVRRLRVVLGPDQHLGRYVGHRPASPLQQSGIRLDPPSISTYFFLYLSFPWCRKTVAIPKSEIFRTSLSSNNKFSGLMSL